MDNMVWHDLWTVLCEDIEIRQLLVFVGYKLGVLEESYDYVNIKNTSPQYYITQWNDGKFI